MPNLKKQNEIEEILSNAHQEYSKGLINYALYKTSDNSISLDLVQDTFMKTWSYLKRGKKIKKIKAFLYRVLNNLIVDYYRKHKAMSLESLIENGFEPSENNSKRMFNIIDGRAVLSLIHNLPEKYKEVVQLHYLEELSLKEISNLTRKSENSIAVKIHRGLKKLKFIYDSHALLEQQ